MIKLWKGDCLERMKDIPDKYIDLIITDPPYGKKCDKGTNGFGNAKNRRYHGKWDNKRPDKKYFDEIFRISKNSIIFGANYFCDYLPLSNHWLIWNKKGDIAFQNPFADAELIYTTFNKPIRQIIFKQQGFITDSKDKRYHPTQKPTELLQILINNYSDENAIICDPFMGSGSTGIACINTNRKFIGIELDDNYFKIAKNRIKTHYYEVNNKENG